MTDANTTKRELSSQAQVAKRIRKFCKALGVKCKATSDSFSMGDSVDWSIENIHPDIVQKIKEYADQHQYGHFDGMIDCYEYSNNRDDIPQTKYCHGGVQFTDDMKQKALDWLRVQYAANYETIPASYDEARGYNWIDGDQSWNPSWMVENHVSELLHGDEQRVENWREFWDSLATPINKPRLISTSSAHIEEHTHTKKGFQMFIVIMSQNVDREEFNRLRSEAQALNGWYSRKWGSTPCGFAFKDQSIAEQFLNEQFGNSPELPPNGKDTPKPNTHQADKLRTLADKLESQIQAKFADRLTNTPKRLAQDANTKMEGEKLKRTQAILYALANLHESGEVPVILQSFTSKKSIYDLMGEQSDPVQNGYHSYRVGNGAPRHNTLEALALWELLTPKTEEEKRSEELQRKINDLQFSNIPGYFPTPQPVIDIMLDYADVQPDHMVLEPSAGSGAIADRVKPLCKHIDTVEQNYTLSDILKTKGYPATQGDFIKTEFSTLFNRVLMNPPFENLQDIDHVQHAFKFLLGGGRLVSVVSPAPFFRNDKKAADFREWFESLCGEVIDLPENSFKESGTNVSTKLIIIDK